MKSKSKPSLVRNIQRGLRGTTLVETIIALLIFALLSVGVTGSLIKMQKHAEYNVSETIALAMAEGVMDQIRRMDFLSLSTVTDAAATPATTAVPVELKLIGVTSANLAEVQTFSLDWAADSTTFTEIGVRTDPNDPTSLILGMLLDVDHKNSSAQVLRSRRYMKMQVNLTKTVNMGNGGMVAVALQFKWQLPNRKSTSGGPVYSAPREIRSVISKMSTY